MMFTCSICQKPKEQTRDNYRLNPLTGFKTECLECEKTQLRCSKCTAIKDHRDFPKNSKSSTGRHSWCLQCHSNKTSKYVKSNRAQINVRRRIVDDKLYHCSICDKNKSRKEFRHNSSTGVKTECLECEKTQLRCPKCDKVKKHAEFPKSKATSTGRHSWCFDCHNTKSCKYAKEHRIERRIRSRGTKSKQWRKAYKQRLDIKIKNRLYQRANSRKRYRDPVNHAKHLARRAVKEAIKRGILVKPTSCQGERLNNPLCLPKSLLEAHHTKGYAQEHWLDVEFLCKSCHTIVDMGERDDGTMKSEAPAVDFAAIIELYLNQCAYCGRKFDGVDVQVTEDHVVPIVRGGLHVPDNIVPACLGCNSKKHDNLIAYKPLPGKPVAVEELMAHAIMMHSYRSC